MDVSAVFTFGTFASAIMHGIALVFMFSGFGALLFLTVLAVPAMAGMPPVERSEAARRAKAIAAWSLGLAVLAEICWLIVASGNLSGGGFIALVAAVPVVAAHTGYGHLVLAQAILLSVAFLALGSARFGVRPVVAMVLSGVAIVLEAWHLHAAAMTSGVSFFLVCEAVHVFAAAAWLGSLLPLALFVRAAPPRAGLTACLRYSAFMKPAVAALVVTAAWQGLVLVGSLPAFVTTAYGRVVLIKIALFGVLVLFALRHRFRMTPALAGTDRETIRRALGRSVLAETSFGVAIVLVAAVLASLSPPTMAAMGVG